MANNTIELQEVSRFNYTYKLGRWAKSYEQVHCSGGNPYFNPFPATTRNHGHGISKQNLQNSAIGNGKHPISLVPEYQHQ